MVDVQGTPARVPVMAFTPNQDTYRRMSLMWGVRPQQVQFANSLDAALMRSDVVQHGDQVVLVCGFPVGAIRPPNMALLHTVGERRNSFTSTKDIDREPVQGSLFHRWKYISFVSEGRSEF